jgi:hypothetical protein
LESNVGSGLAYTFSDRTFGIYPVPNNVPFRTANGPAKVVPAVPCVFLVKLIVVGSKFRIAGLKDLSEYLS